MALCLAESLVECGSTRSTRCAAIVATRDSVGAPEELSTTLIKVFYQPASKSGDACWRPDGQPRRTTSGRPVSRFGFRRRDRWSGSAAFVVVVQPAEMRDFRDRAAGWRLRNPPDRRLFVQREVRAGLLLIGTVLRQQVLKASGVPDDHVIEARSPPGSDQSLNHAVLPRRSRSRQHFGDIHGSRGRVPTAAASPSPPTECGVGRWSAAVVIRTARGPRDSF